MGNLVDAVGQFVMGVWDKINTGRVYVKAAFETQMKFIMGGLGARHLP